MRISDTDWTTEAAACGLELVISDTEFGGDGHVGWNSARLELLRRQRHAQRIVVACDSGVVAGHAIVEMSSPGGFWAGLGVQDVGEIRMLATRDSYRRKGLARAIVEHIVSTTTTQLVAAWRPTNVASGRLFADWEQLGTHLNPAGIKVSCARHHARPERNPPNR